MGHSFIICGCLSIITGIILIVIGVSSATSRTMYVGIGIITLGVGFFLTTLVCLYGKLDICYNNWAYRARVLPVNLETPQPAPVNTVSHSPFIESPVVLEKHPSPAQVTVVSEIEINKVVIGPTIQIGTNNFNNVT
jgi:hypothetical protein